MTNDKPAAPQALAATRCDRCGSSGDVFMMCAGCQEPLAATHAVGGEREALDAAIHLINILRVSDRDPVALRFAEQDFDATLERLAALPASPLRGREALVPRLLERADSWIKDNGRDDVYTCNLINDLLSLVLSFSASPPEQPAADPVTGRETCIECGKCDPCDDECPNYREPELPAARPMGQS